MELIRFLAGRNLCLPFISVTQLKYFLILFFHFLQSPPPHHDHPGKKIKNENDRLLMLYNVCLNQFFEFLTQQIFARWKLQFFLAYTPLQKRSHSHSFLVLHSSGKYYAKQPLLNVNWADFWKSFVSWRNSKTWFIYGPPSPPPHLLREKVKEVKIFVFLCSTTFVLTFFFVNALFKKLMLKT